MIKWRYSTSIRVDQWSALAPGWTDGDGSFLSSGGEGRSSSMPSVRDALDGYVQRLNLRENREGEKLEEIDGELLEAFGGAAAGVEEDEFLCSSLALGRRLEESGGQPTSGDTWTAMGNWTVPDPGLYLSPGRVHRAGRNGGAASFGSSRREMSAGAGAGYRREWWANRGLVRSWRCRPTHRAPLLHAG